VPEITKQIQSVNNWKKKKYQITGISLSTECYPCKGVRNKKEPLTIKKKKIALQGC